MDQGGTFTDVVHLRDGRVTVEKHLSDRADLLPGQTGQVRRGTTVATNALLERTGVPTLLITNRGLSDVAIIGDQCRPELFALHIVRPPPLHCAVLEIDGRIDADGTVLTAAHVDAHTLQKHRTAGIVAVAVVLLHGPLAPQEEQRIGQACRQAGLIAALGHEVAPSRGFLDRLRTTLADAALSPLLPRVPGLYMRSDGGLATEDGHGGGTWRGRDAVLSGPAGGVIACAALAKQAGVSAAFGLDMGGTSTDICRVDGTPERVSHVTVGDWRMRAPAVRLQTVAAGGGSRLSVQAGVYAVGPRSAGADPGPAAYGRGGPATVTDCEAVLGRLPTFPNICGSTRDQPLDTAAAQTALQQLDPHRPIEAVAAGFQAVAAETMAGAIRALAAQSGADPRHHALIAFGGAGPGHACAVAQRLDIDTVLVPLLAGVFSAVGIGMAVQRAEAVVPIQDDDIATAWSQACDQLPFNGRQSPRLVMRHVGTAETLELPLPCTDPRAAFHSAHSARFGFSRPDMPTVFVEVRVAVESDKSLSTLPEPPPSPLPGDTTVRAWFGQWRSVPLLRAQEADGVDGPALLLCPGTTVVVPPSWRVSVQPGHLRLTRQAQRSRHLHSHFDPVHTAIFSTKVMSVATHMGMRLAKLARSVSIRQRHDFSCAIFDADGRLVANAPHVPVHLGAMGETVRDLLARKGHVLKAGQVWVSNDPYAGGSHLPDITVMRPVYANGVRFAVVACRGHHVDVGGIQPGSMPPAATHIDQEGLILRHVLLADGDTFLPPDLPGCRQPDVVLADLHAQVAACALGHARLHQLINTVGFDGFVGQLQHLRDWSEQVVRQTLLGMQGDHHATEHLDDGTPLSVRLHITGDRAVVTMNAPQHPGNRNAPTAVARAALLYVFRCLADSPIPLNEGALAPFTLVIPPHSMLAPRYPSAVAGGNVETSQRLVDALLRAVGALAASQGTMNNLTVGTAQGAFYETIGGGSGAGPGFDGADAVQVHMTNTRATDIEELECRFPVRIDRWSRRNGSGGSGQWRGGDGTVREWTFLAPAAVAMMAERRIRRAPGLAGGEAGKVGCEHRDVGAGWEPAPPTWMAQPGDRLRVSTPGGGGYGSPSNSPANLSPPVDISNT